ncbi:LOW QUALITY PROTEIN: F-actin-capping protein subunit alpha-like [Amphiura filiformis]|uniref:LOW QUALITY PROTEIN: F-actin-capping protein subunit alpha-like n=1 Tax=Amphiura filiformis TaxID=82378 RepID=UPI003B21C7A7
MAGYEEISDQEKVRIAKDFIVHAPPGEFNEVFNDVRILVNDDKLLKEGAAPAFIQYNKDQFTTVKVGEQQTLVTEFGDLGNNRFLDPSSKQSFKFDHLRKEASEFSEVDSDSRAEPWRLALDEALAKYRDDYYKNGVTAVYGKSSGDSITLVACIEDHKFEPNNYWNGRWRSQWSITFQPSGGNTEARGNFKVQVHYYEDGNVQLVSHKDVKEQINVTNEEDTANSLVKVIGEQEGSYQTSLTEDYGTMSKTTFKALRRQLPLTRTKIDWNKIASYKVGQELKGD